MTAITAIHAIRRISSRTAAILIGAVAVLFLPGGGLAQPAVAGQADRVLLALGGKDKIQTIDSISIAATGSNYGAMDNFIAGGPPIHLSDDRVETTWRPDRQHFRNHTRLRAFFPFAGEWEFSETFNSAGAVVSGPRDFRRQSDFRRQKDNRLAGVYVGAALKRLWLSHPQWVIAGAGALMPGGKRLAGGAVFDTYLLTSQDDHWVLEVDPATSLPHALSITEIDGLRGEVTMRAEYGDWRPVSGIMMPFRLAIYADKTLNRREIRDHISVRQKAGASSAGVGGNIDKTAVHRGWSRAHWFNERSAMARGSESRADPPVKLKQVGPGIFHITGSSHHNLLIVGPHSLAVVDAPFYPARSAAVLTALRKRWPGKKVQYLVLTHHHADHVGGYRSYVEAGAELVVAATDAAFYRHLPGAGNGAPLRIMAAGGRLVLPGFGRPVELLPVPNSHAEGMLAVYMKKAKLLFVTDLYSPGRPAQHPLYPAELMQAIRFAGLDVARLVGGHGGAPDDLARLRRFIE